MGSGNASCKDTGVSLSSWTARTGAVRSARPGFSPLDERLQICAGHLLPTLVERGIRLALHLSFDLAAVEMAAQHQVQVSSETLRRATEAVGAVQVQREEAAVVQLCTEFPRPPVQPSRLVLAADGGMVRLRRKEWAEIKLVALGEPVIERGEARMTAVSYYARLADAETFATQSLGELHRRGVETAGAVEAVQDGAEWLQGYVDLHRPDALRVLDFYHAAERLHHISVLLFGEHTPHAQRWVARKRHQLRQHGPDRLLDQLHRWHARVPAIGDHLAYLEKRRAQLHYPQFAQQGWVLGSGAVESGHKHVWQARLKGPGMAWDRSHINPMLVLRLLLSNERWAEVWSPLWQQYERQRRQQRCAHHQLRRHLAPPPLPPTPSSVAPPPPTPPPPRPPSAHPWRRYPRSLPS